MHKAYFMSSFSMMLSKQDLFISGTSLEKITLTARNTYQWSKLRWAERDVLEEDVTFPEKARLSQNFKFAQCNIRSYHSLTHYDHLNRFMIDWIKNILLGKSTALNVTLPFII